MRLVLEFHRVEQADDPFAFRAGRQQYVRRTAGGGAATALFDWDDQLLQDLASLQRPGCPPAIVQRLGDRMQRFLAQTDWPREAAELAAAVERSEPVRITLRLGAAELYALPWELLTFKGSGEHIGALQGVLFHYEWPDTRTTVEMPSPRPEGGRILLAWSAASGDVPAAGHQAAIAKACAEGYYSFDPSRDVLAHASVERLLEKLEAAADDKSFSVLHILCHGSRRGSTFGLAFDGADQGGADVVDGDRLRRVLSPHAARLRLVVLCACDSANSGEMGNHLGSVAQALHRVGIQAVVASRFPLSVVGSVRLTEALYTTLLGNPASLESSIGAARQRLLPMAGLDWASVQLYLRSADGDETRPVVFRPYRGLLVFEPEHHRFFFGRDDEEKKIRSGLNALIAAGKPRLLVVAGASGTGKSSLVLACAVPRLLKESEARWQPVRMRPGGDPQKALEQALDTARKADAGAKKPLLLIVDQFEELFTHGAELSVRQALAKQLWAMAKDPQSSTSVLLTLRVDFIGQCGELILDDSGLRLDRVAYDEAHRVFVATMGREQLRAAIEEPAHKVGLHLEEGLVNRMLQDVGTEPGALPLLEYTLDLLWEHRQGPTLTQAAYDAVGGVAGALHGRADKLMEGLDEAEQRVARRLLVRLVSMGEGASLGTRRRVPLSKMLPAAPADAGRFEHALALLVDARLLVRDGEKGQPVMIEVAHEALIRTWSRLTEWVQSDRQMLAELEKVDSWVGQWKDLGTLLSGNQLGYVAELEKRYREDFPADARELLRASQARADQERLRIQKARRRTQLVAALFAAAAVVLGGLGAWAWRERQRGQQRRIQVYEEQGLRELQRGEDLRALVYLSKAYSETKNPGVSLLTALAQASKAAEAQLVSLEGHEGWVFGAGFSPDGDRIVTASEDKTAKIWDTHSGKVLLTLIGHQKMVVSAAFNADGTRVVTASQDNTAKVWDALSGKVMLTLDGHQAAVNSAAFSADGTRVVTTSGDNTAKVWDALSRKEPLTLRGHQKEILRAAFSADGNLLVTASFDKTAKVWDARSGQALLTLQGHQGAVVSATFSADGNHVVTASFDQTAKVWDTHSGKETLTLEGQQGEFFCAVFSPDGHRILTANADKTARIWDAHNGKELFILQGHQDVVNSAAFSADGTRVVTASRDRTAKVWDAYNSRELRTLQNIQERVLSAPMTTDGTRVVTASSAKTLKIWDALSGKELRTLEGHQDVVKSAAFNSDGTRVVTTSFDKTAKVWDVLSGKELLTLHGHQGAVYGAAFSADGTRVVTTSKDNTVKVWDARSGKALFTRLDDQHEIWNAALSTDGIRVVTASSDNTAKIWNVARGEELLTLHGHQGAVYGAAFSADGTRVVTTSKDNTVKVWDVALETRSPDQIAALVRCRAIFRLDAEGQLQEADPQIRDCPPQKRADPPSRQLVRIQNLRASGRVAVAAGNLKWAQIYGQQATQLSQEQGWQDEEAQARILLGDIAKRNADPHEAQSHYEKACALYHGLRWPEREAWALRRLSDLKHEN